METDRTKPPASQFDGHFITQPTSEKISPPYFPRVSFNYRTATIIGYGYLQN